EDVLVDFAALDHLAITEDAVFAVQNDVPLGDEVGHEGGDTRSEVDVTCLFKKLGRAASHLAACPARFAVVGTWSVGGATLGRSAGIGFERLLDDAGAQGPRYAHPFARDVADADDLVDFDNGCRCRFGKAGHEIAAAAAQLDVAERIGAIAAQEGIVDRQRLLEDVRLAFELAHLFALGDGSAYGGRGVENWKARPPRAPAFEPPGLCRPPPARVTRPS